MSENTSPISSNDPCTEDQSSVAESCSECSGSECSGSECSDSECSDSEYSILSDDDFEGQINDSVQDYTLVDYIAKGSYGVVWKATKEEQVVALKIARSEEDSTREVDILTHLPNHEHIIVLLDTFMFTSNDNDQHKVMVFPLFEMDLFHFFEQHDDEEVDLPLAKELSRQLLAGIAHMAKHNVVHSDLKPENLLLRQVEGQYHLAIADLGCASITNNKNMGICLYGKTTHYRSPEIIVHAVNAVSCPTDVWSAACIIFELYTNGDILFNPRHSKNLCSSLSSVDSEYSYHINYEHLALVQELLGPFPRKTFGKRHRGYFNAKGVLKNNPQLNLTTLHHVITEEIGLEEPVATQLVEFLQPMLRYRPDRRITAEQALVQPFLVTQSRQDQSAVV